MKLKFQASNRSSNGRWGLTESLGSDWLREGVCIPECVCIHVGVCVCNGQRRERDNSPNSAFNFSLSLLEQCGCVYNLCAYT